MAKRSKKNTATAAPPPVEDGVMLQSATHPSSELSEDAIETVEIEIEDKAALWREEVLEAVRGAVRRGQTVRMNPDGAVVISNGPVPPVDAVTPSPADAEPGIVVGLNFKFAAEEWARARDACLKIALDECDSESTKENGVVWANCAHQIAAGIRQLQEPTS